MQRDMKLIHRIMEMMEDDSFYKSLEPDPTGFGEPLFHYHMRLLSRCKLIMEASGVHIYEMGRYRGWELTMLGHDFLGYLRNNKYSQSYHDWEHTLMMKVVKESL